MEHKPVFLTEYALVRYLKAYGQSLGLSSLMADATAQIHARTHSGAHNWSTFLQTNCANCLHSPDSCVYLNPGPENILGGATPEDTQTAIALQIEGGRLQACPARKD